MRLPQEFCPSFTPSCGPQGPCVCILTCLALSLPSWVFPVNAQQGPTPDSSSAPCPVSSSQESWKLSSSLSLKMFKLHPEPQLSQHQLLIIVQSKLPCSVSPTFQARWGRDMMRKTLGLFSCQLPQKVRARARPEAT